MSSKVEDLSQHHPHRSPVHPLLPKRSAMSFEQFKQLLQQKRLCAILNHGSLLFQFRLSTYTVPEGFLFFILLD
jgi:hypothetical protein